MFNADLLKWSSFSKFCYLRVFSISTQADFHLLHTANKCKNALLVKFEENTSYFAREKYIGNLSKTMVSSARKYLSPTKRQHISTVRVIEYHVNVETARSSRNNSLA